MKTHQAISLLCLSMAGMAQAQVQSVSLTGTTTLAGQSMTMSAAPDPELNWRDPQWLARQQRERSKFSYQLGLEQQQRSPVQLGPQAAVREAVWAGVSYDLTQKLRGGVEAPVWQRDTGWASRMNFERNKKDGISGLRGAFSYQLSPTSQLALRPNARRVQVSYSAKW